MLAIDTEMFLLIPDASNTRTLHPGKVIESDAQGFVSEFEEPIAPPVGTDVNAYGKIRGKFFQQGAVVVAVRQTEPHPVIAFTRVGEPVSAENRQTFRVCLALTGIHARIDSEKNCPVVDMSAAGFGAIAAKVYELGTLVPISLEYDGNSISTLARVQTVKERAGGKFRYGFLVSDKKSEPRKVLEQISASIQRQQLRRLAGAA
jgi:hypothetical protein